MCCRISMNLTANHPHNTTLATTTNTRLPRRRSPGAGAREQLGALRRHGPGAPTAPSHSPPAPCCVFPFSFLPWAVSSHSLPAPCCRCVVWMDGWMDGGICRVVCPVISCMSPPPLVCLVPTPTLPTHTRAHNSGTASPHHGPASTGRGGAPLPTTTTTPPPLPRRPPLPHHHPPPPPAPLPPMRATTPARLSGAAAGAAGMCPSRIASSCSALATATGAAGRRRREGRGVVVVVVVVLAFRCACLAAGGSID